MDIFETTDWLRSLQERLKTNTLTDVVYSIDLSLEVLASLHPYPVGTRVILARVPERYSGSHLQEGMVLRVKQAFWRRRPPWTEGVESPKRLPLSVGTLAVAAVAGLIDWDSGTRPCSGSPQWFPIAACDLSPFEGQPEGPEFQCLDCSGITTLPIYYRWRFGEGQKEVMEEEIGREAVVYRSCPSCRSRKLTVFSYPGIGRLVGEANKKEER